MRETTKGVLAMIAACTVWGLSALYYKLLETVPPIEILAHRTLWSLIFFALVLMVQGRIALVPRALSSRAQALAMGFAALMISANWFLFITSIQIGRAMEASLGYYMFPLVAVCLGAVAFGERLGRVQWLAVALVALAVTTLTAGLGVPPWIALILATTFGLYGLAKKRVGVGPVVSVTTEVLLLAPVALAVLVWCHADGQGAFGTDWGLSGLLALSGPLTATPLILFSYATRRVTLATVGLVQYLNPSLQFLVATLIFREAFSLWHAVSFAMIWTALVIYTTVSLRQDRAARRALESA